MMTAPLALALVILLWL